MREIAAGGTFDAKWYLARYPDIERAGVNPLQHYVKTGWSEGRDPSSWFSTSYYLTAHPDVAAAGVNPLWHYTVAGRREGRQCYHPGGVMAEILSRLEPLPQQRKMRHALAAESGMERLTGHRLAQVLKAEKLLVISLSHDDYREQSGGIQLCLQIEQSSVEADLKGSVLNLYPRIALPSLATAGHADSYELVASLNGRTLGVIAADGVLSAFEMCANGIDARLVIHSLLGHAPEFVVELYRASRAKTVLFWIHDYFAACSGYSLMRNDVKYCGAPSPESGACLICIHGSERRAHLERVRMLFQKVPFHLVAPSESAKRAWKAATGYPGEFTVLSHCSLIEKQQSLTPLYQDAGAPARIAFLGHSKHFKGWNVFVQLARDFQDDRRYQFIHLGSRTEMVPNVVFEDVSIARDGPNAMIEAVRKHQVDVALTWSLWPETFGFVGYEALAAGAKIVTWDGAGNLADLASRPGAGLALPSEAALRAAFEDGTILALAMSRRENGRVQRNLSFSRMSVDVLEKVLGLAQ